MRRAIALVLTLVVVTVAPAFADVTAEPGDVRTEIVAAGGDEHGEVTQEGRYGDADGEHGTEPAAFLALLVAGMAMTAAVAAMIFARKRQPA